VPAALGGAGWLYQRVGLRRDAWRYPERGLLLSRGGRYLHVVREGMGQPAVLFEAGLAATSLSWARVQPVVAEFAETTSYDRAGLGWSGPISGAPSLGGMLADLDAVVRWAGGGAPVVLAAHSFGGLLALAYARQAPERVAALVLLEPVSLAAWRQCGKSDQYRLQTGARLSRRGAWLAEFGVVRATLGLLLHGSQRWSKQIGRHAAGPGAATLERLAGEVGRLPREAWPEIAAQWSRAQSFRTLATTLEALPALANAVGVPILPPEMPVAILSAESATADELRERETWLGGLLHGEHQVLPGTGHWLHIERPQAVAEAVRWCMDRL